MKLSAFPIFPDSCPAPTTAGAGITSGASTDATGVSCTATDPSAGDGAPADFAAIFGHIVDQGTAPVPDAPSASVAVSEPAGMRGSFDPRNAIEPDEAKSEAESGADSEAVESRLPSQANGKGRATGRRDPEEERPTGVTPESPAWQNLLGTPAAVVATAVPTCDLPTAANGEGETGPEEAAFTADTATVFTRTASNAAGSFNGASETVTRYSGEIGAGQRHPEGRRPVASAAEGLPRWTPAGRFIGADGGVAEKNAAESVAEPGVASANDQAGEPAPNTTTLVAPRNAETSRANATVGPVLPEAAAIRARQAVGNGAILPQAAARGGTEPVSDELVEASPAGIDVLNTAAVTPRSEIAAESVVRRVPRVARHSGAENISGLASAASRRAEAPPSAEDKTLLTAVESAVAEQQVRVGTTGANQRAPMSPATPLPLEASALTADAVPANSFDGSVVAGTEGTTSAARHAIDSILSIADRVAGADGQTVNLRFSIGENDLHVRVGYAGEEVRTTFVTESPELRAMLLQEWQALSSAGTERAVRLAEPVFGSAGQNELPATNSSFDSPSQQHRDSAGRREAGFAPSLVRPAAAGADFVPAASAAPARGLERSTQRLHTFA